MQRRTLLQVCAAAAATGALAGRAEAAPQDETWRDARRARDLPLRLRWPEGSAPCALIVHSHGLGGNRMGGDVWGRAWQQAGFAVLHVQHPGSDSEVLRGGLRALRAAANAEQWFARVADVQFVLDEVARRHRLQQPGWARVRLAALGASGHSFGAVTVQALAGQRFAQAAAGIAEPRFKAFVAFSPSPAQGAAASQAFEAVTRPFLCVTGSQDSDALGRGVTGADRARVFDALPAAQRALLWLEGADHMTFAGNAEQRLRARFGPLQRAEGAADSEAVHHERVATITTLWWRARLLGDAAALAALREPPGLGAGDRWQSG
jgi:predicted dienelactone hydrolase